MTKIVQLSEDQKINIKTNKLKIGDALEILPLEVMKCMFFLYNNEMEQNVEFDSVNSRSQLFVIYDLFLENFIIIK